MKEKFIPGIYNYCDRWCERCTFTRRCRSYDNTSKLTPEQTDISNEAFWKNIGDNFSKAIEMLHTMAAKHGNDLNNAMTKEEEEEYKRKESFINASARQHELSKLCKKYQKIARPFFEKEINRQLIDRNKKLFSHLEMGMETEENLVHTMAGLGDCEEIICWYLFFIDAKLQRALHGKLEGEEHAEEHGFPKDSNGSAKIAVIAIEKSMAAWMRIMELMSSAEDTALTSLSLLSRIRKKAIEEFPEAMQFRRPGFDD